MEKNESSNELREISEKVLKTAEVINKSNFELRALQIESDSLADEIAISRLSESQNENIRSVANNLLQYLDIPVVDSCVKLVKRIGKPMEQTFGRVNQRQRDVLIKFESKNIVNDIISKAKTKTIPGNALIKNSNFPADPVRVHRRHPSFLYKFRQLILKEFNKLSPKNVWIAASSVFVRFSSEKPPLKLLPSSGMEILRKNLE